MRYARRRKSNRCQFELAVSLSNAVGSAVGANPIAFIIPCHRVIRETGVLGNYRWDPIRKCAMIGWEISARSPLRTDELYRIRANAA